MKKAKILESTAEAVPILCQIDVGYLDCETHHLWGQLKWREKYIGILDLLDVSPENVDRFVLTCTLQQGEEGTHDVASRDCRTCCL